MIKKKSKNKISLLNIKQNVYLTPFRIDKEIFMPPSERKTGKGSEKTFHPNWINKETQIEQQQQKNANKQTQPLTFIT